eukprot:scaffold4542_cov161-Prasinococcus_capsulatus_cf.AAC.1
MIAARRGAGARALNANLVAVVRAKRRACGAAAVVVLAQQLRAAPLRRGDVRRARVLQAAQARRQLLQLPLGIIAAALRQRPAAGPQAHSAPHVAPRKPADGSAAAPRWQRRRSGRRRRALTHRSSARPSPCFHPRRAPARAQARRAAVSNRAASPRSLAAHRA